MSSYQQFLVEKEKIDTLLQRGYKIKNVRENLSGSFVEFELENNCENNKFENKKTLLVTNADARKYFSSLIFQEKRD
ncbi:hypothetical protein [Chengkuizengella sediminis]|uniref:hypothetical protein n=1 Tax=Chengkuizengella sediminis TaxID=1885917 RepID=UPI0013898DBE|nr:hypothetical protein [Chengkuizengella sediminis]NDI35453.1 hypothetical protein [Chengkuizengella sediminis]